MTPQTLDGRLGTSITLDVCLPCQVLWFDTFENLKLAPAAVLTLFRLIGEQTGPPRKPIAVNPACPRCGSRLALTHDQQRNTHFQYKRCPHEHGRLSTFVDWLKTEN